MRFKSLKLFAAAWLAAFATGAVAQTVKIGVVLPYTGVGAEFGQQVDRGMQMFMKLNPKAFEPYKIEIVKRDSKNPERRRGEGRGAGAGRRRRRSTSSPASSTRRMRSPPRRWSPKRSGRR